MMVVWEFREAKLASDGSERDPFKPSRIVPDHAPMISGVSGRTVRPAPQYAS
jgi:hypothetical protein